MPVIVMNLLHVGILGYRHTCLHPAQDTDTCYGTALLHLLCISQIRVKVIGVVGVLQRKLSALQDWISLDVFQTP